MDYQLPCPVSLDQEPTPVSDVVSDEEEAAAAESLRIAAAAAVAAAAPKLTPFHWGADIRTLWRRCSAAMVTCRMNACRMAP